MNRARGFTLIELTLVIVLTGIVAASVFQILDRGLAAWRAQSAQSEIREDARWIIHRITREVRQGHTVTIPQQSQISFTWDEDGNGTEELISYRLVEGNLQRKRGGGGTPLLTGVSLFSVTGGDVVTPWISLSLHVTEPSGAVHRYQISVFPREELP